MENGELAPQRNIVLDKSFRFAAQCVRAVQPLETGKSGQAIVRQFLRSGTSVGANVAEAQDAQSKADFISKCSIALNEAREAHYWLRLMRQANLLKAPDRDTLVADCEELIRILVEIVKSSTSGSRGTIANREGRIGSGSCP